MAGSLVRPLTPSHEGGDFQVPGSGTGQEQGLWIFYWPVILHPSLFVNLLLITNPGLGKGAVSLFNYFAVCGEGIELGASLIFTIRS